MTELAAEVLAYMVPDNVKPPFEFSFLDFMLCICAMPNFSCYYRPALRWDSAFKTLLFKNESKLFLCIETFPVLVVSLSYNLCKLETVYKKANFI